MANEPPPPEVPETPEAPLSQKRTFPATIEMADPYRDPTCRRIKTVDAQKITLTTPSGQTVVIEPSPDGEMLLVYNPHGKLDHSIRPKDPPRQDAEHHH